MRRELASKRALAASVHSRLRSRTQEMKVGARARVAPEQAARSRRSRTRARGLPLIASERGASIAPHGRHHGDQKSTIRGKGDAMTAARSCGADLLHAYSADERSEPENRHRQHASVTISTHLRRTRSPIENVWALCTQPERFTPTFVPIWNVPCPTAIEVDCLECSAFGAREADREVANTQPEDTASTATPRETIRSTRHSCRSRPVRPGPEPRGRESSLRDEPRHVLGRARSRSPLEHELGP